MKTKMKNVHIDVKKFLKEPVKICLQFPIDCD